VPWKRPSSRLYADTQKVEFFKLKEELYYFIEEKSHDADLTEMGRNFLSPDEPDAFVLPDIATVYSEIDGDTSLSEEAASAQEDRDAGPPLPSGPAHPPDQPAAARLLPL
jgi:hypothetical protein